MSQAPSHFVWYELMTTDAAAAEAFYAKVIGWTMSDAGMPGMRYTLLGAGKGPIGGLMALDAQACEAGARPAWSGYVAVVDVDAHAQSVVKAGGSLHHGPEDIPGVGRFAMVSDPQGAVFALFTDRSGSAFEPPPDVPGTVGWRELNALDGATAFDFYGQQFGWTKADAMDMGALGVYQMFAIGGTVQGGMMTKPSAMPMAAWLFYFNVEAIDAAMARVREGGGQILHGPEQVPGSSWIAQCLDPQGAVFAMVAPVH